MNESEKKNKKAENELNENELKNVSGGKRVVIGNGKMGTCQKCRTYAYIVDGYCEKCRNK